jgi:hypothetical protein
MKASLGLLASLTVVLSLGCGKSDPEKFADSYCAEVAKCCGRANLPADGKACHDLMTFASMGGSYDAKAGDACLAEMRSEVAAGTFCASLVSTTPTACDSVYGTASTGSKKPGETCEFDFDCAPSSNGNVVCASLYVGSAFIYKCQVQVQGKVGDTPCAGTKNGNFFLSSGSDATDIAPSAIVCSTADGVECTSGTCTALTALGATCSGTSDCVRSAFCDPTKHQCIPKVTAGAACPSGDDDECLDGNYCAPGTKVCMAKGANGAACTTTSMCLSSNCPSGTCESNGLDTFGLALICGT